MITGPEKGWQRPDDINAVCDGLSFVLAWSRTVLVFLRLSSTGTWFVSLAVTYRLSFFVFLRVSLMLSSELLANTFALQSQRSQWLQSHVHFGAFIIAGFSVRGWSPVKSQGFYSEGKGRKTHFRRWNVNNFTTVCSRFEIPDRASFHFIRLLLLFLIYRSELLTSHMPSSADRFARYSIWQSGFFVFQVMGFSAEAVATFIAVVGVLSVAAQTAVLGRFSRSFDDCQDCHDLLKSSHCWYTGLLMRTVGAKATILIGLVFEMLQLAWYGFGSQMW